MSSDKYTWISTDRKTEAEVLKELAAADTPVVILTRDEPDERTNRYFGSFTSAEHKPSLPSAVLLHVPRDNVALNLLRKLPQRICWLAQSAWDASFFIDSVKRNASRQLSESLNDWILSRRLAGETIHDIVIEVETNGYRPLQNHVRRALIPAKPNLSEFFRTQIDRLAGLEVPSDSIDAIALRAGIYLWHDAIDESHELSQSIEGKGQHLNGDYVHAILHRREPDYGNAKYWFRHVGRHPNFDRLGQEASPLIEQHAPDWESRLLKSGWAPFAFIDFCEQAVATKNSRWIECAETIQEIELLLLLDNTARHGQ